MVEILWLSARTSGPALASADTVTLGSLAVSSSGANAFRVASMDYFVGMDKSGGAADGESCVWVLSDGQLTLGEIEAALNLNNMDSGDKVAHDEEARREVHPFAITSTPSVATTYGHTKINRTLYGGISVILYNPQVDAWVASIDFCVLLKMYGVWVD